MAGTGMESVRETVDLTNRAAAIGYKAVMVRTPHYYKNLLSNPDAQTLFFRAVADQAKIPLMIYNWPQATGVDIAPDAVNALSEALEDTEPRVRAAANDALGRLRPATAKTALTKAPVKATKKTAAAKPAPRMAPARATKKTAASKAKAKETE